MTVTYRGTDKHAAFCKESHQRAKEINEKIYNSYNSLSDSASAFFKKFADDSYGHASANYVLQALTELSANDLCTLVAITIDGAMNDDRDVSPTLAAVIDLIACNAAGMGSN